MSLARCAELEPSRIDSARAAVEAPSLKPCIMARVRFSITEALLNSLRCLCFLFLVLLWPPFPQRNNQGNGTGDSPPIRIRIWVWIWLRVRVRVRFRVRLSVSVSGSVRVSARDNTGIGKR